MKSSKQIADYVFKKRDEHEERKKIIVVRIRRTTYVCSTLCAAILIVVGINALKPAMDELPNMIEPEPITTETTVVPDPFGNTESSNASESSQAESETQSSEQPTSDSNIFSDASSEIIDIFINPDKHEIITGTNSGTGTVTKPVTQSEASPSNPTVTTNRVYGPTIPGHTTTISNGDNGQITATTITVPTPTYPITTTETEEIYPMPTTSPTATTKPPEFFVPITTAKNTTQTSFVTAWATIATNTTVTTLPEPVDTNKNETLENLVWEDIPIQNRFDEFTYNSNTYAYKNAGLSSSYVDKLLATITISAKDYNGKTHYETIAIYSIKNTSDSIAVKFSSVDSYFRYIKQ